MRSNENYKWINLFISFLICNDNLSCIYEPELKKNKNNRNSKVSKFKMFVVFFVHSIEKSIIINGKFHVFRCCDEINKYQKLNWEKKNFSAQLSSHTKWKKHRMSCFFIGHIKTPKIASIVTIPSETSLNVNGYWKQLRLQAKPHNNRENYTISLLRFGGRQRPSEFVFIHIFWHKPQTTLYFLSFAWNHTPLKQNISDFSCVHTQKPRKKISLLTRRNW